MYSVHQALSDDPDMGPYVSSQTHTMYFLCYMKCLEFLKQDLEYQIHFLKLYIKIDLK